MTAPTLDSFFSGGGGKSVSWRDKPLGTTVSGTIKAVNPPHQQTDPVDGSLQFKKDKVTPKMSVRIDLATNERDVSDPEDDGSRGLYVQGWLQGAIGDALRKAGRQGAPEVGATLTVTLVERTPNEIPALAPTNKFVAQYVPPAAAATGQFFQQPAAQQPVQQPAYQAPVPQPQYAPAPGGYAAPPPQYVQQPPAQPVYAPPPVQAEPEPARPPQIAQGAWDAMPLDVKKSVATTMAVLPGAGLNSPGAPPY